MSCRVVGSSFLEHDIQAIRVRFGSKDVPKYPYDILAIQEKLLVSMPLKCEKSNSMILTFWNVIIYLPYFDRTELIKVSYLWCPKRDKYVSVFFSSSENEVNQSGLLKWYCRTCGHIPLMWKHSIGLVWIFTQYMTQFFNIICP